MPRLRSSLRVVLGAFSFLVPGLAMLSTATTFAQDTPIFTITDSFAHGTRNARLWSDLHVGTGPVASERAGHLEFIVPSDSTGGDFRAGYITRCSVRGDFDVRVDYQLIQWPAGSGVRLGLVLSPRPAMDNRSHGISRTAFGSAVDFPGYPRDVYVTNADRNGFSVDRTNDRAGTLRLERIGNLLRASFASAGAWSVIGTSTITPDDLYIVAAAWSSDDIFTRQSVTASFENFELRSTGLNCPAPGVPSASASGPYDGMSGTVIELLATGADASGDPLTFDWDLGGDGTFKTSGQRVSVILDGTGSIPIALRACDAAGICVTDNTSVTVRPNPHGAAGVGGGGGPASVSATPELESVLLFGSGAAGIISYAIVRRRK